MADKNNKGEILTKVIDGADKANQGLSIAGAVVTAIIMVASLFKK
ncbi:hypothetical protein ABHC40_12155 [Turicibacter sanguinis]